MLCVRSDARKTMVALAWAGSLYVQRSRRRRGDAEAAGMFGDGIGSSVQESTETLSQPPRRRLKPATADRQTQTGRTWIHTPCM